MEFKTKKEVIILGKGESWEQCPFDCETWTVNDGFLQLKWKRLNKIFFFDKHFIGSWHFPGNGWGGHRKQYGSYTDMRGYHREGQMVQMTEELFNELGIEVCSTWMYDIKNFEPYPIHGVLNDLKCDYFINSIAWMIAYAIYKKYTKIKLYGIDFRTEMEIHGGELAGVEFWLGYAQGRGIELEMAKGMRPLARKIITL